MKKLFLLDAYTLIFRAYYAFIKNPRYNSKGINTSAIFGFTNTLDEIIKKEKPSHLAVVFDLPGPTFRHEMFPQYKAQRQPTPEDIKKSVPYIKDIIRGFNIPVYEMQGYEADDVVGTLAKQAEKQGFQVYMMTSDKDFGQLVSENIFIYKPKRSGNEIEILGAEDIKKQYGIKRPEQVIDILAIWGDVSDNVPGIPGVGEKIAMKLISQFDSVEGLYRNVHLLSGKQKENVIASKSVIDLSKVLVTINTNVPIEFNEKECELKDFNNDVLKCLFDELEFNTLASRLLQPRVAVPQQKSLFDFPEQQVKENPVIEQKLYDIQTVNHNYILVDTFEARKQLIDDLLMQPEFCFDTETTGLEVHKSEIVGLSISFKKEEAYYIPFPANQEETIAILNEFQPIFANQSIRKIGQNCKFDILVLKKYGIEVSGELFDTMIAHYLLQSDQPHNLDHLAKIYLNYKMVSIEELIGKKGINQGNMRNVEINKIKEYASEDADIAFQLKSILLADLEKNNLLELATRIEMPLIYVLAEMEFAGINIDTTFLNDYAKELQVKIHAVEKEILHLAGTEFNIASPKQLGEILFERLKIIDDPKLTKTKQYSTNEQELQKLKDKHPIIPFILEYRTLQKLLNTYVVALPELINPVTNKVHTSFNQSITSTGRLSSNNPNLQNIPIRTAEGREIRKAFIPSDDNCILVDADYSQIELRLIAHIANDENMIEAFKHGADIHSATASKIFNVPIESVTKEMRSKAKSANFGIVYGISSFGLAENLNISRKDAKELIDNYFKTYPKIKLYMDNSIKHARDNGYVQTISGRKQVLPDINSRNAIVRGIAERNAINSPVQGSAADVIKIAMINLLNIFKANNLKSKIVLQVHDELVFDVYKPELDVVKSIVKNEMENALTISVPLSIEMNEGKNWLEAH